MKKAAHIHSGFSLIEVTIAIGVAAFCLVAVFGLLPVGLSSNLATTESTAAGSIASSIIADLRSTAKTASTTPRYKLSLNPGAFQTIFFSEAAEPTGPTGSAAVSTGRAPSRRRATVFVIPPSSAKAATMVRILVTWPALGDSKPDTLPEKYAGSFEVMTAVNRN